MSLIRCPECNKKISSTVSACPRCGYQISPEEMKKAVIYGEKEKPKKKTTMLFVIIASSVSLLLLVVFAANANFGWFGNDPTTPIGNDPTTTKGMVHVKGGTFQMGDEVGDLREDCLPVHTVNLTYDYWMGKYEVTFDDYDAYTKETGKGKASDYSSWMGYYIGRGTKPVINVTWDDAIGYCNWLSDEEGYARAYDQNGNLLDKNGNITTDITKVQGYRLPTEAEWEYAARGGQNTHGYKYAGSDGLDGVGWYWQNAGDKWLPGSDSDWSGDKAKTNQNKTHAVGEKKANELGLYDMSGNVFEWCHDRYGDYVLTTQTNPTGPGSGDSRVNRGGSWSHYSRSSCRVAYRASSTPTSNHFAQGFRLVRTAF